jgi:uncharacterized membrane protein YozB (DUF420 family)
VLTRFVGAIVPKQFFVQTYAYFTFGHFILNIAAATYLLYVVAHFSTTTTGNACQAIIQNARDKDQCIASLTIAKWVYFVVTGIVLLIELCASI